MKRKRREREEKDTWFNKAHEEKMKNKRRARGKWFKSHEEKTKTKRKRRERYTWFINPMGTWLNPMQQRGETHG